VCKELPTMQAFGIPTIINHHQNKADKSSLQPKGSCIIIINKNVNRKESEIKGIQLTMIMEIKLAREPLRILLEL